MASRQQEWEPGGMQAADPQAGPSAQHTGVRGRPGYDPMTVPASMCRSANTPRPATFEGPTCAGRAEWVGEQGGWSAGAVAQLLGLPTGSQRVISILWLIRDKQVHQCCQQASQRLPPPGVTGTSHEDGRARLLPHMPLQAPAATPKCTAVGAASVPAAIPAESCLLVEGLSWLRQSQSRHRPGWAAGHAGRGVEAALAAAAGPMACHGSCH